MLEYRDIIEAIKNDRLYDFISNNYWRIDKTELRDIILELYIVLYNEHGNDINNRIIEELKQNRDWDE